MLHMLLIFYNYNIMNTQNVVKEFSWKDLSENSVNTSPFQASGNHLQYFYL